MSREFADAILFSFSMFDMREALRTARTLRLLNTPRPFVRAVPGGWLATAESVATFRDTGGNEAYDFLDYRRGVRIGFRKERENEA